MRRLFTQVAIVSAALTLVCGASAARASTWLLEYAAWSGQPAQATLSITTSDTLNSLGGFDVTGISGSVDGDEVTGLTPNPNQPTWSYSPDGLFLFDNVLFPDQPSWLSNPGVLFTSAGGFEYNLFSDSPTQYELYKALPGVGYVANSVGMVSAQQILQSVGARDGAIPEPTTWALLIAGFGAIGLALRAQRRRPALNA
jgi:hypothetical protein